MVDINKQGISKNGVLITARGKELYKWIDIHHADIFVTNTIKIIYYDNTNTKITTQFYSLKMYDGIISLFQDNNLNFETIK